MAEKPLYRTTKRAGPKMSLGHDNGVEADNDDVRAAAIATIAKLDADELTILAGIASGESCRSLAAMLEMRLTEAANRRADLMTKLGANSIADLVRIALIGGIDR